MAHDNRGAEPPRDIQLTFVVLDRVDDGVGDLRGRYRLRAVAVVGVTSRSPKLLATGPGFTTETPMP